MAAARRRPSPAALPILGYLAALAIVAGVAAIAIWQSRSALATRQAWQPGAIDIGFAQAMSQHHQQAIAMAQLMQDGRPSRLLQLARSIEGEQQLELGEMRGWLKLWQQPLQAASRSMDWMLAGDAPLAEDLRRYRLDCQRAPGGMPGLASLDELERLRTLEGVARDRHFLKLMLAHHQGALPMARFAAEQASLPVVQALATQMLHAQADEIDRIDLMLQALPELIP